jgi:anti-sigma regulatory factor (Ser/Thr protein kinase)
MSLRGRGLWLIGQLVDELRLAKARPGTPVILRRCIPRRLRRLGELRDGRVGINE